MRENGSSTTQQPALQGANAVPMGKIKISPAATRDFLLRRIMKINIRDIDPTDKKLYFEMSRDFYGSGAAKGEISDDYREKFWNGLFSGGAVNVYVLEYDGCAAGYAITFCYLSQEFGGNVVWIDELYVKPRYRGKGLGKRFLEFAENIHGAVLVRLEAEPENGRALDLYKSVGYKNLKYMQLIKKV